MRCALPGIARPWDTPPRLLSWTTSLLSESGGWACAAASVIVNISILPLCDEPELQAYHPTNQLNATLQAELTAASEKAASAARERSSTGAAAATTRATARLGTSPRRSTVATVSLGAHCLAP